MFGRIAAGLVHDLSHPVQNIGNSARLIAREVSVTDTGSGIPPERLSAIFEDFVTTKRRGLGLGLAICKRIVEQLDGTISVASEVGRGTAFTVRFPLHDDGSAEAAAS
jgi:signal transduction histidine kinase